MSAAPPDRRTARSSPIPAEESSPLDADEFGALMAAFGPFESRPMLGVAVSGGADSLALCLLAAAWARERHGTAVGLTVDHGLREGAAEEARRVGIWLGARGIDHHVLVWRPPPQLRNIQATARVARYALLSNWCRAAGCLHLLTAHHREDQAETLLMRLARGSGLDGLAGIAALRESADCRLLRPLLGVPRQRLAAVLSAAGQPWIEDPSNRDAHYTRARLRGSAALLAREGLSASRLAATARHLGRARAALEDVVTKTLTRATMLHPAGYALLDPGALSKAAPEVALRVLARLAATIGGSDHAPRLERLERLHGALVGGLSAGRTLGRCRFLPWRGSVLVCRETASAEPPRSALPGTLLWWDGRFMVRLAPDAPDGLSVGALGSAGLGRRDAPRRGPIVPAAARATLPALRDLVGIVSVPHLNYVRPDVVRGKRGDIATVAFRPRRPLTAPGFTVVQVGAHLNLVGAAMLSVSNE
jgi:tRNA(Ile)-lysidine synthase